MPNESMNLNNIDIPELVKALNAGQEWALGLRPGMMFTGARPEALSRYQNAVYVRVFVTGALSVLEGARVVTAMNGVILEPLFPEVD